MRMRSVLGGIAAALALSTAADAAIVVTTFEGTVSSGVDYAGLAKAPGTDLSGLAYTAVFTFDTSVNFVTDTTVHGPSEGAYNIGSTTPFISATFTVDGHTLTLNPARFDVFTIGGYRYNISDLCACLADPNGDAGHTYMFDVFSALTPASLSSSTSFVPDANSHSFVWIYDTEGEPLFEANGNIGRMTTAVQTGAIPEPATWALMILGFGGAGTVLRHRRQHPVKM